MTSLRNSVGIVQSYQFDAQTPLRLESGKTLEFYTLRYETYGTLNTRKTNAILIEHALSGSSHAAGFYADNDLKPGWWDILIGPGKAFDTDRFFIVVSNCLGSCYGSTGPASINPQTNRPFGIDFPCVTIADMVDAQKALTDFLGIKRWYCIAGGSMGGMQTLLWAIKYPERVEKIIPMAVTPATSPLILGLSYAGRQAILRDPKWANGHYDLANPPANGLAVARMMAHVSYLSLSSMNTKFARRKQNPEKPWSYQINDTEFEVESYLNHQGQQFVTRFDANSYLIISRAIDYFSLYQIAPEHHLGKLYKSIKNHPEMLILSYSHDWLYMPEESKLIYKAAKFAKIPCAYYCIKSDIGHDAFLIEVEQQTELINSFLNTKK